MADLLLHILPEIIMSALACICALLKHQITQLRKHHEEERKTLKAEYNAMKRSLCALLRADLVREHQRMMGEGYCTNYAYESYINLYKQYKALGGNGMAKHLMDEIDTLPIKSAGGEHKNEN